MSTRDRLIDRCLLKSILVFFPSCVLERKKIIYASQREHVL